MGSKFGMIQPGTYELTALERLEKSPFTYNDHSSTFIFGWIFFILADNNTNHKSSDEFEFPSLTSQLAALERQKN